MFTVSKRFEFSAAHHLPQLPDGHPCKRPHGHNYTVEVRITTPNLDERGFVIDYGDLKPIGDYLDNTFDHRDLNDVLPFAPTAERLAKHLWGVVGRLLDLPPYLRVQVGVSETPKTWAYFAWTTGHGFDNAVTPTDMGGIRYGGHEPGSPSPD